MIAGTRRRPSHKGEIGATGWRRLAHRAIPVVLAGAVGLVGLVGLGIGPASAAPAGERVADLEQAPESSAELQPASAPDSSPEQPATEPERPPPPPPPSTVPTPGQVTPDPTTIAVTPSGFSPTGFVTGRGTAQPGSRVVVTADGTQICSVAAADDGTFDCGSMPLPDGDDIEIVASETPANSGTAAPEPARASIDVLRPPAIDGGRTVLTTGLISGTGRPGAGVTVDVDGAADAACTAVPVATSSYWSCNLSATSGTYAVQARQSDPAIADGSASDLSSSKTVIVDRDSPASAVITAPAPGAIVPGPSITVSGTGETGAAVDLYVDDVPACAASVADGRWSCQVGDLARGQRSLQAIMRDAAGNYASPSEQVKIIIALRQAAGPSVSPTPSPGAPAEPGTPAPLPGDQQTAPDDGGPSAPPADAEPTPPTQDGWSIPTGFGGGIRPLGDSVGTGTWFALPLVALLFLALVAIPLRMLASALRGRVALPRLTGRNRARRRRPADAAFAPAPMTRGVTAVGAASALTLVSVGVAGEVRYLRLYLAIAVGLAVLNLVGAVVATRVGARMSGIGTTVRFIPLMFVAAAITAVVSRVSGIEPPIITGVLMGAAFAAGTAARQRALVSIAQVGAVALLGVLGWVLLGAAGTAGGFWVVAANEMLATICLAGLGSALVLVLPIASLPGRVILEWSPTAWVVTTLAVSMVSAGVVFGGVLIDVAIGPWLIAAASFAAVSVAVWAYVRFVEPVRA